MTRKIITASFVVATLMLPAHLVQARGAGVGSSFDKYNPSQPLLSLSDTRKHDKAFKEKQGLSSTFDGAADTRKKNKK